MCKKDLLNQLKNLSKTIPNNLNNIKNTAADQIKNVSQKVDMNQVFNKTKQELNSKQQAFKQYANKAKQLAQNQADQLRKNSQKLINTTYQYTNKVFDQKNINKQKENIQEIGQKIKQKIPFEDLVKAAKQSKYKIQQTFNKPKQDEKKYSPFKIAQSILKKNQQKIFNGFFNQGKKFTGSIFSNLYWRILFALCLLGLVMVSPQFLKHGGELWLKHKKLEQQKSKSVENKNK